MAQNKIAMIPKVIHYRLFKMKRFFQLRRYGEYIDYSCETLKFHMQNYDVPSHSITPDAAQYINKYIRENNLKNGVEIGSKFGWSGIWLSSALKENGGQLLMIDPKMRGRLVANYKQAGVDNATFLIGDSTSSEVAYFVAEYISRFGKFDFAFIDGNHNYDFVHSDYHLVTKFGAPEMHVVFDNYWECPDVMKVFINHKAKRKIIAHGFSPDVPGRDYQECLAVHVIDRPLRKESNVERGGLKSSLHLQPSFWGGYFLTSSGMIGDDVDLQSVS